MQGDGQVPGGPPGPGNPFGNPFEHPFEEEQDLLDEPLSPFNKSPLDPMSNPLTEPETPSGHVLDQFERGIENTPPIRPGPNDIGKTLDMLEDDIEGIDEYPRKFDILPIGPMGPLRKDTKDLLEQAERSLTESDQIEIMDDGFSPSQQKSKPITSGKGTGNKPSLPYYLENSQRVERPHKSPHRSGDRIGRRGGKNFNSSQAAQGGEFYCPIEDDYVSEDFCQDQDCEYYDEDWEQEGYDCPCTCDDEEDL